MHISVDYIVDSSIIKRNSWSEVGLWGFQQEVPSKTLDMEVNWAPHRTMGMAAHCQQEGQGPREGTSS